MELSKILEVVSIVFDISIEDLKSEKRNESISIARHAYCFLAKIGTSYTLKAIGDEINRKDHTTIMNSLKQANNMIESNTDYKANINYCYEMLKIRIGDLVCLKYMRHYYINGYEIFVELGKLHKEGKVKKYTFRSSSNCGLQRTYYDLNEIGQYFTLELQKKDIQDNVDISQYYSINYIVENVKNSSKVIMKMHSLFKSKVIDRLEIVNYNNEITENRRAKKVFYKISDLIKHCQIEPKIVRKKEDVPECKKPASKTHIPQANFKIESILKDPSLINRKVA